MMVQDFEEKMVTLLHIYREMKMINNGVITETVDRTRNRSDSISFLKKLDSSYPVEKKIRLILDNLRVYMPKRICLKAPNIFEFIFSQKHRS